MLPNDCVSVSPYKRALAGSRSQKSFHFYKLAGAQIPKLALPSFSDFANFINILYKDKLFRHCAIKNVLAFSLDWEELFPWRQQNPRMSKGTISLTNKNFKNFIENCCSSPFHLWDMGEHLLWQPGNPYACKYCIQISMY